MFYWIFLWIKFITICVIYRLKALIMTVILTYWSIFLLNSPWSYEYRNMATPKHDLRVRMLHEFQSGNRRLMKRRGLTKKRGRFVPHKFNALNKLQRLIACQTLLHRPNRMHFLKRIVTCDESWVCYDGRVRKIHWGRADQPAPEFPRRPTHAPKQMLCVWWGWYGVYHWELLPPRTGVNANLYCTQLDRVRTALTARRQPRGQTLFHQDNAPPHRAQRTTAHIENLLGWRPVPQPPYSPDIAPSDYYLFRALKHFLRDKEFQNAAQVTNSVQEFFGTKMGTNFYRKGIAKWPEKWRKTVDCNGGYFVE